MTIRKKIEFLEHIIDSNGCCRDDTRIKFKLNDCKGCPIPTNDCCVDTAM